jgi:hypothetical protein
MDKLTSATELSDANANGAHFSEASLLANLSAHLGWAIFSVNLAGANRGLAG